MLTINQIGKRFGLSRSTLLYYDKIGLLRPSGRSDANYRLYSATDADRLKKIVTYREMGLSLQSIADILNAGGSESTHVLEARLLSLNDEISRLRQQQQLIVDLLGSDSLLRKTKTMSKAQWVNILRASGMDDSAMHQWHIQFERDLPEVHQDFLESLGCSPEEVTNIRRWSGKTTNDKT